MTAEPALPEGTAIIVLGSSGMPLARRLKSHLPGAKIHGFRRRVNDADLLFDAVPEHLSRLFVDGVPIVGLCAAGILIRSVARHVTDKQLEAPVVAVAEDGSVAVPLLGGHRGANALARLIADQCGGKAAITTAGDLRLGLALDDPPAGWRLVNPEMTGPVTAALLAGEPVTLQADAGDADWLTTSDVHFAEDGGLMILVTDRSTAPDARTLVFHPPTLAIGIGCERGTSIEELEALVESVLAEHGLARASLACLASIDLKADEESLHKLAKDLAVSARFFGAETLEAETPRLANPSDLVFRTTGCHGVAEGAALAAAGANSTLIVPKTKSQRATCAVARANGLIDAGVVGQPRGCLHIVGIGPGGAEWRSPAADRALGEASDVVGYSLYLELIERTIGGKAVHSSDLGEEEARVRVALDLAADGRTVALVSSGDAGIYALAALVFEILDREDRTHWNRVRIDVTPGISAMQAAAARAGAPLGHDFCAVSLSDLLTPWPEIERRLEAAGTSDFVICLYNPASSTRRHQIEAARDVLLASRRPETPVILARNLGRTAETVELTTLGTLDTARVDMLTLVIVGNSRTRLIQRGPRRWIYTPRGYGDSATRTDRRAAGE